MMRAMPVAIILLGLCFVAAPVAPWAVPLLLFGAFFALS